MSTSTQLLRGQAYSSIYALLATLDEDWDFSRSRRLEDFGQLSNGLLEDVRRANIDFGDYHHDWNVERKSNSEMLSV